MKVTGFTFIRNAIKYDYPVVESIKSVLPLCDDFVVAVGNSEDGTLGLIRSIDKEKIRIIETTWDDSLREGGRVLALETDKAFAAVPEDSDWAFYIQGDEVVHEQYHKAIHDGMIRFKDDTRVDGLLFSYLHFYGSYDYVGSSEKWYRHEIRIIRNDKSIHSFRDAQGFRKGGNSKLRVKAIDAFIYHYGWVKAPEAMQKKQENFNKYWHDDQWITENIARADTFDYSGIDSLEHFNGTHPAVMQERIMKKNWQFDYDLSYNRSTAKDRLKKFLRKKLGLDFSYRNYRKI